MSQLERVEIEVEGEADKERAVTFGGGDATNALQTVGVGSVLTHAYQHQIPYKLVKQP